MTKFPQLVLSSLPNVPLISKGDDLVEHILNSLHLSNIEPQSGDILAIAQKIISKSEGRLVALELVEPSAEARELAQRTGKDQRLVELILQVQM